MDDNILQYVFPQIRRVQLHSFSLFRLRPDAAVTFKNGVLCLAGANGIGKSTFLGTVNYGLTGAVPHPRRRLLSIQSYLKDATDYSSTFFDGRIDEKDRETAAVTIEFSIGARNYEITRGLFDPSDVRSLSITGASQSLDGKTLTPIEREAAYKENVTRDVGLSSFEQFLFLQHFVFTFDEARHLLFWDEAATSQALFLCFGGNPKDAQKADLLNREAEKAGSRGRNAQFQVNNIRKRIEVLNQSLNLDAPQEDNLEELDASYRALLDELETAVQTSEKSETKLSEVEVTLAEKSATVASLRARYTDSFNRYLGGGANVKDHPLVVQAIREEECDVCHSSGASVAAHVHRRIEQHQCPFCASPILDAPGTDSRLGQELAVIDAQLAKAREELDETTLLKVRLSKEAQSAQSNAIKTRERLAAFENNNQDLTELLRGRQASREGPVAQTLIGLEKARIDFIAVRDAHHADRDALRAELKSLQRSLEARYARAEQSFVPRFRELTNLFLGIDLDVSFVVTPPTGVKLVVEMRGDVRHEQSQMSESQRFFVDIALRMALAQQMSAPNGLATLFIDTPEGSLDIAYEDRAGEMFARFTESGHDMLITANINSSKLLSTLAARCGNKGMTLNQMTGWTELSDVQQAATALFQEAYEHILSALRSGPA